MDYNKVLKNLKEAGVAVPENLESKIRAQIKKESLEKDIKNVVYKGQSMREATLLSFFGGISIAACALYSALTGDNGFAMAESAMAVYSTFTSLSEMSDIRSYNWVEKDMMDYLLKVKADDLNDLISKHF